MVLALRSRRTENALMVQPTLRQMEYLVAVAETLNFRKAAERRRVSTPGV